MRRSSAASRRGRSSRPRRRMPPAPTTRRERPPPRFGAAQTRTIGSFFTLKQGQFSIDRSPSQTKAQNLDVTIPCDGNQKAISGGFQYSQAEAFIVESGPTADGHSWHMQIENYSAADGAVGDTDVGA